MSTESPEERSAGNKTVWIVGIIAATILILAAGGGWYYMELQERERAEQARIAAEARAEQERRAAEAERKAQAERQAREKAEREAQLAAMDKMAQRWADGLALAVRTARISLPPQIAELQAIRRDLKEMPVPPCLVEGKQELLLATSFGIDGVLSFLREAPSDTVNGEMARSVVHTRNYQAARQACDGPPSPAARLPAPQPGGGEIPMERRSPNSL